MSKQQNITLDTERHEVKECGREIDLKPKEFEIFSYLMKQGGKVVSRKTLLREVWGVKSVSFIQTRTIDQHVARLRKKFRKSPIKTVPLYGYKFKA